MTYKEMITCLSADEFSSLFLPTVEEEKKKENPKHIFHFPSRLGRHHQSAVVNQTENHRRGLFLHDADADRHSCMKGKRTSRGEIKLQTTTL